MPVIKMNNNLFSKTRYNIKSIVLTKFVNRREKERFFSLPLQQNYKCYAFSRQIKRIKSLT